jgi:UDP-glucose-4-epimerase GalE
MSDLNRVTVLVTGGAGYIGSHTCKELSRFGFTPVALDNLCQGHNEAARWGPLEVGDLADSGFLDRIFSQYRPIAVLHFAAHAYVGESMEDPLKYYRNNVAGTITLLDAMRRHRTQLMVLSSSCATYGLPKSVPILESDPQRPINPYGASKLMVERVLADSGSAYGFRYVSLRYFNAGGADSEGLTGEAHEPETHLIPLAILAALGKKEHLQIFGDDYDTPDGTCVRDYVHVSDLAMAHVMALQYLQRGGESVALNLGSDAGSSVRQVVDCVERYARRRVPVVVRGRRPGDPPVLIADSSAARRLLGWQPLHSTLDEIVASALRWHIASEPAVSAESDISHEQ